MAKYKNFSILLILVIFLGIFLSFNLNYSSFALDGEATENYIIYDEQGEIICEKSAVEPGDTFITKDFEEYEIQWVDQHKGYAKLVKKLNAPKIKRKDILGHKAAPMSIFGKRICLYMTHNDESYTPTDGYDSIYGAGGIHDVARKFQEELTKKGINVILDETLHIPHNSTAYSRSSVTANKLLNTYRPDAMFDVHRDGVSKSFYYYNNNGDGYSKIRIVVGKSNPNFNENYEFAKSVFAVGNSMYPWLFSDIYCGSGHYNQALQTTDLLFEMGTYLIEKEYVLKSLPLLANVVNTVLYASEIDENGDITVDETVPPTYDNPTNESHSDIANSNSEISSQENNKKNNLGWILAMITSFLMIGGLAIIGIFLKKNENKSKR